MNLLSNYSFTTSLKKGAEPTIVITALSIIVTVILQALGIDLTEKDVLSLVSEIVGVSSALYGIFCTIRNWIKNRKK